LVRTFLIIFLTCLIFQNVVVSGLSACFAQLPTFHEASPELLGAFVDQIKFVDNVTTAGSPVLASNIADCFLNAFLLAIIEPAMTQVKYFINYISVGYSEHLFGPSTELKFGTRRSYYWNTCVNILWSVESCLNHDNKI